MEITEARDGRAEETERFKDAPWANPRHDHYAHGGSPRKEEAEERLEFEACAAHMLRIMEESHELREETLPTPDRVTRMWLDELTSGYHIDIPSLFKLFPDEGKGNPVIVHDIPVRSVCEHHLVPFVGYAQVAYKPKENVVGLSKLPRLVNAFSRRLQIQERLTQQIVEALETYLKPDAAVVVVEAEHLCMTLRGVQAPGTRTKTLARVGDPQEADELLILMGHGNGRG